MTQYYTVEEANRALPRLARLAEEMVATHRRILALRPAIAGVLEKSASNSGSGGASLMYLSFLRLEALIGAIQEMGVEIKDVATGLCDFVALHEGRDIYLCWRVGEPRVEWWHDLHTGFAGRRHVDELLH